MPVLNRLLRRELQEHRGTFLYLPLGISAFIIALLFIGLIMVTVADDGVSISISSQVERSHSDAVEQHQLLIGAYWGERLHQLEAMPESARAESLRKMFVGLASPLLITYLFVAAFYLLGSLYDDRKDRSILFWKSMPVSDALTIASKLLAALVVAPAIYFACAGILHLMLLLVSTLSAIPYDISVGETLWGPSNLLSLWLTMIAFHGLTVLWCLPTFGWLLFVSAWVRSAPLVVAIAVPVAVAFVDKLFIPGDVVSSWMARHMAPLGYEDGSSRPIQDALGMFVSLDFVVGVLVACAFIYGAVLFRRRADEL